MLCRAVQAARARGLRRPTQALRSRRAILVARLRRNGRRAAAQPAEQPRQGRGAQYAEVGDQRRLGLVGTRHRDPPETGGRRGGDRGQHATDRAQLAVKPQLAEERDPVDRRRRNRARGTENGHGDAHVEAAAPLGQAGRGQADRDPALGPLLAAVHDRGPDPVPCLTQRRVGQAHQEESREPVLDVGLNFDRVTLYPDQGDRVGAGNGHSAHPPHVLEGELP